MEPQFVEFLDENNDEVVSLLKGVDGFRGELRTKVRELGALINLRDRSNVRQWLYKERTELWDALVHDIMVSNKLPGRNRHLDKPAWLGDPDIFAPS
jgi:hypothetical protein